MIPGLVCPRRRDARSSLQLQRCCSRLRHTKVCSRRGKLALGKLAKEFQLPTQKDHFHHHFLVNGDIAKTLTYVGPLPEYRFFEPKRTSRADYDEMFELYRNGDWNYLKVSEQ
jgi:hypothetical protein